MRILYFCNWTEFDGLTQMAIDYYFLTKGIEILRIYGFNKPTVSLGKNQTKFLYENDWEYVRRPTGGRAVYHNGDVVFSLISSIKNPIVGGNILESYKKIAELLKRGFEKKGISLEIFKGKPNSYRDFRCFSSTSRYEIVYKGKKVIGIAQVRKKDYYLTQASIQLFDFPREMIIKCVKESFEEKFILKEVSNLKDILNSDEVKGYKKLFKIDKKEVETNA